MLANHRVAKVSEQLMVPQLICSAIEFIANKALSLNSQPVSLAHLVDKTLTVELAEINFPISITVSDNTLLVTSVNSASDCTLVSSIATLRKLQAEQQLTELIKQEQLDIKGDIKVAQQFAVMAETLNIDWQTELAKHIGDVPTYKLTTLSKKGKHTLVNLLATLESDVGEYIVHERKLAVTHSEITGFTHAVEQTSEQLNKIESRLARLVSRLNESQ